MQISQNLFAAKIPFQIKIDSDRILERFVYVYLLLGEKAYLIDTGVAGCEEAIWALVKESERTPSDIDKIIFTHAHPDHIGGAFGLKKNLDCSFAASKENVLWIEDVEQQFRERPAPNFHTMVGGSVKVNQLLKDGDIIELGENRSLRVIDTPGHSKGHIALFYEQEGVLISGDSIPLPGQIPIYEAVSDSLRSIEKLASLKGVKVLLGSWDEPRFDDEVQKVLSSGTEQIQMLHRLVQKTRDELKSSDKLKIARQVFDRLGLPESGFIPLFVKTIEAHLDIVDNLV